LGSHALDEARRDKLVEVFACRVRVKADGNGELPDAHRSLFPPKDGHEPGAADAGQHAESSLFFVHACILHELSRK
jgi:hypothetical protein